MNNTEHKKIAADRYKSVDVGELSERFVRVLGQEGFTVAVAESCTGGLMGKLITDVPGASSVFVGGAITYTNKAKIKLLGVSVETIEKYTEVSFVAAEEMAQGASDVLEADIGISATGFAGPLGGNEKDPVGTVYIGIAFRGLCEVYRLSFDKTSSREDIRRGTACFAFDTVIRRLSGSREDDIGKNY